MDPVILTDLAGLLFWRRSRVAMVRVELEGRLEVLSAEGELAHRPGPLSALAGPPFQEVAAGVLVHPAWAVQEEDLLVLPGGWRAHGALPAAPATEPPEEDPFVEDAGCRASEVLYIDAGWHRQSYWVTTKGRVRGTSMLSGVQKAHLHPDLRGAGLRWHVNPRRLRFLRKQPKNPWFVLGFDEGTTLEIGRKAGHHLARNLGLPDPEWIGGETPGQAEMRRLGLRRWPVRLSTAPAEFLKENFAGEPARLVLNLALQTVEALRRGEAVDDGDTHRGWLYRPTLGALHRAGMVDLAGVPEVPEVVADLPTLANLVPGPLGWRVAALPDRRGRGKVKRPVEYPTFGAVPPLEEDSVWILVCRVLAWLVDEARFFDYREMGFRDARPDARLMGTTRPGLVLLVEKDPLLSYARALHRAFGCTVFVSGGVPSLLGVEYLVQALREAGVREVRVVSYSDYDVVGWDLPVMFAGQLDRYGMPVTGIRRMVTPEAFTPEERRRRSVALSRSENPRYRGRLRRWMAETGGVDGRPRGIPADVLEPLERVVETFRRVVGEWLEEGS